MKILLVQTSFLGDTVLSTPVIAAIKKLYPTAELWMMVTPQAKALVERDPLLAGVIVFAKRGADAGIRGLWNKAREIRQQSFDMAYSLHKSWRTALVLALAKIPVRIGFSTAKLGFLYTRTVAREASLHDVLRNLCILGTTPGADSPDAELRLYAPDVSQLSTSVQQVVTSPPYVVLVPGSAWPTKMWNWEGYREVAQHFLARSKKVVVVGGPDEVAVARKVSESLPVQNLTGIASIAELLSVIKNAALVVCNDSMALHVASAFKVPTVPIFCATSPRFGFGPWRNRATIIEKEGLSCKPCRRHGGTVCPTGTESCMRDVPAPTVIAAAERLLSA